MCLCFPHLVLPLHSCSYMHLPLQTLVSVLLLCPVLILLHGQLLLGDSRQQRAVTGPPTVNLLLLLSSCSYIAFRIWRSVFWLVCWAEFRKCKYYKISAPVGDGLLPTFPFSKCCQFWNVVASGQVVSLAAWHRQMLLLDKQLSAMGGLSWVASFYVKSLYLFLWNKKFLSIETY